MLSGKFKAIILSSRCPRIIIKNLGNFQVWSWHQILRPETIPWTLLFRLMTRNNLISEVEHDIWQENREWNVRKL